VQQRQGAAARAAAAAQNEQMEAARIAKVELENKMLDLKVRVLCPTGGFILTESHHGQQISV
jgi:hypothetical protein